MSDELFALNTWRIGSLMTLINRACRSTIPTGAERIDLELLSKVKNDAASQKDPDELHRPCAAGKKKTA
ncbi:hypothetical protein BFF78_41515 [Streptomyces fodineus]|uniref:Uncharacterized protein n=1 Tax=Streptomyces fodineus TaxID=1904616 RepID=A0A1D7YM92_9ACTN|nr:hypothetical protein BFF78_41515 [Streptomyces fodineus]